MLELEYGGRRYAVPQGESAVGADPSCLVPLSGPGVLPRHAILRVGADGALAVLAGVPGAEVAVNGVRLGGDPAPLLHGDKLQVTGFELLCVDPHRGGSTQFLSAKDLVQAVQGVKPSAGRAPTASTGGRLVCLTDGREYSIGAAPLTFGREAGSDIVVPNKDVSRHHAEILATPQGYVVVDSSTNGTFVNGERIEGQRVLARADVIRVGDHDFRFYADLAPAPAPVAPPPPPPPPAPAPAPNFSVPTPPPPPAPKPLAGPSTPAPGASQRLNDTMMGTPVSAPRPAVAAPPAPPRAAAPAAPQPLATILVRTGALKGNRLPIRVPVVNIGRADYNDLVIPDDSVSSAHAKLQRREGVWVLTDLDSTNGTMVDGEKVTGEAVLSPGATVRLGEVGLLFDPPAEGDSGQAAAGTKVMGAMQVPAPAPAPAAPAPARAPAPPPAPPSPPAAAAPRPPAPRMHARPVVTAPRKQGNAWLVPVLVVVVLAAAAVLYFLLR
jgi:pSer/pThr/pTyr-binding forkhead associated (FHA) protein